MAHVFYPDLLHELAAQLTHMPHPYSLMVSVVDEAAHAQAQAILSGLPRQQSLHIRVVPNRGRDIAPFLVTFREEILAVDLICHVHTKKSLYGGQAQVGWRNYLFNALFGSHDRLTWIFGMFQANPALGMIYPESHANMPLWGHTWLSNGEWARQLAQQLGLEVDTSAYLDFPAGSMFWARTSALRPLFELGLRTDSFPPEQGQIDGTLQHAIERMLSLVIRQRGMTVGVLPSDGGLALAQEGERNRQLYFDTPLRQKIDYFAAGARTLSFDVFDTLVLRPFLTAQGARDFLALLVEKRFGIDNFGFLRARAETHARARAGRDVCLQRIYAQLREDLAISEDVADAMCALELTTEQRLLLPRETAVAALGHYASDSQRTVVGISDMYIGSDDLKDILPSSVSSAFRELYVSCDTGWRKDTAAGWRALLDTAQVDAKEWLHIGDNEHADVMRPLQAGMLFPVHVLRPAAYLDVVPALRGLRPSAAEKGLWSHELWLGLIANHFAQAGDAHPEWFAQTVRLEQPESFGYTVLGPLIADYLAWLARTALERSSRKILFLSREGYVLHRLYQRFRAHVPTLAAVDGRYLLVSRRGVNTPATQTLTDLAAVFHKPYTGTFFGLVDSRLGRDVADAARQVLGKSLLEAEVYLPEMSAALIEHLQPLAPVLEDVAKREREAYMRYWQSEVVDGEQPIVADVGYAGSIQTQLSRVVGKTLGGLYFAVTHEIGQVLTGDQWALARYHDGRKTQDAAPVQQYHLLLESVLTSPSGQFSHFELRKGRPEPVYRENHAHAQRWPTIERIHSGAERFVDDLLKIAGEHALAFEANPLAVQEPLRCAGSGRWRLGVWSDALSMDDAYTGRGQVNTLLDGLAG